MSCFLDIFSWPFLVGPNHFSNMMPFLAKMMSFLVGLKLFFNSFVPNAQCILYMSSKCPYFHQ